MKPVALKLGICSMLLLSGVRSEALAQSKPVAQGVMLAVDLTGDMVVQPPDVWTYDEVSAMVWYSHTIDGEAPAFVDCTGPVSDCAASNEPSRVPAAPPPDLNALRLLLARDKCTFFDGGELSNQAYAQSVIVPGQNGKGRWGFNFSYRIAPHSSRVSPRTAWRVASPSAASRSAAVTLGGYVAAQSTVMQESPAGPWRFKTSHGLLQADGRPLLDNLWMTVRAVRPSADELGVELVKVHSAPLWYAIESHADFFFWPNAGVHGSADQLVTGMVNRIQLGHVRSPRGIADDFAENDMTLGDRAVLLPVHFNLADPGSYIVSVTGTVKDMDGLVDTPFAMTEFRHVMAGACTR